MRKAEASEVGKASGLRRSASFFIWKCIFLYLLGSSFPRKSSALLESDTGAIPTARFAATCSSNLALNVVMNSLSPCLSNPYLLSCSCWLNSCIGSSSPNMWVRWVFLISVYRSTKSKVRYAVWNSSSSFTLLWDASNIRFHIMGYIVRSFSRCVLRSRFRWI